MDDASKTLQGWIEQVAAQLANDQHPQVTGELSFLQRPDLLMQLVECIEALPETPDATPSSYITACLLAFDIAVAQLQTARDHHNKHAQKMLDQLMIQLATVLERSTHAFGFWLPVLNAFYEMRVALAPELQDAFIALASREDRQLVNEQDELQSMRDVLKDLAGLSDFDIAEHLFSQGHAMPIEFYVDLLLDLYSVEEGQELGVLFLLHANPAVRRVALTTLDHLMSRITLSELSLTRLKVIQQWYPTDFEVYFSCWMKLQRRQGVRFLLPNALPPAVSCYATEVDGTGSQGLMLHIRKPKHHKVCGILYQQAVGLKEVWVHTMTSASSVKQYYQDAFDERVILRKVDFSYVVRLTNHFLALTLEQQHPPPLYFLELHLLLGEVFQPEKIDPMSLLQELGVSIAPFTPEVVEAGLHRTKQWGKDKPDAQSWFEEDPQIDAHVNECCTFVDGVKICSLDSARERVMSTILETKRDKWGFHFLWVALWAKAQGSKRRRFWQDAFLVAYAIFDGVALHTIPIMQIICQRTVMHSLDTMHERRSHLTLTDPQG